MKQIYQTNGLVFWTEEEIEQRDHFKKVFARSIKDALLSINKAWSFHYIEAPTLTPSSLINQNYTEEDVWFQTDKEFVLRPETTPGSYEYAKHLLKEQEAVPPFCVWQAGKSYRREQDQVSKNMRLKEFYQQEFQCLYTTDTANDYHAAILPFMKKLFDLTLRKPTRLVASDRLPDYSEITMDVEIDNGDKWMEVCSISRRKDFSGSYKFQTKKGLIEKEFRVLEIAIGLDRCVYNWYL